MAAPNIITATSILGKSTAVSLTTTAATSVVSNAASSGHVYKVNTLNVANSSASATTISISYYNAAALGGTAFFIVGTVSVPAYATLNVIDKTGQYYLEENTSIGATANIASNLTVTCSYEDIN